MRPNLSELSEPPAVIYAEASTAEKITCSDPIYAIPGPALDTLPEAKSSESESTICPDSSIAETCSSSASSSISPNENSSTSSNAQPGKVCPPDTLRRSRELETPVSTDIEPTHSTKEAENAEILEEEIKCLPDVSIENDSTDDGTDSNEDFLTDDFEYSTSLKASLAEDDDGFDVLDHSWKRCLLPNM
uniref:Uncharacterized protein n=1 Tax=Ditylenchus dipsaci TaxID=166011 RepID=A0A915D7P9_9BILA